MAGTHRGVPLPQIGTSIWNREKSLESWRDKSRLNECRETGAVGGSFINKRRGALTVIVTISGALLGISFAQPRMNSEAMAAAIFLIIGLIQTVERLGRCLGVT